MSKSELTTNKLNQQANNPATGATDQTAENLLISERVNSITRATEAEIRDAMTMTKPTTMSHFFL